MKKKDLGFVLNRTSYSETSIVLKCFTLEHGLKSFLLQGGKKKHSSILQALMPIEFTFYQKNEELAKMYEPSVNINLNEVQFHHIKSSYLFFEAEILVQCLKDGQIDKELFHFVYDELIWLNENENSANYLLFWLIELTDILGIKPHVLDESAMDFDLQNGEISKYLEKSSQTISHELIPLFSQLVQSSKAEILEQKLDKETRKFLLNLVLEYLKIHLSGFKNIKSLEVYQTIWYD